MQTQNVVLTEMFAAYDRDSRSIVLLAYNSHKFTFNIHFLELFSREKIELKIMRETVDFVRLARVLQFAKKAQKL